MYPQTTGAIAFIIMATVERLYPGWNGLLFDPALISDETSFIVSRIYIAGALILFCSRPHPKGF